MVIAGTVVIISGVIGVGLGAISGYFAGRTDFFIQKLVEVIWAFPPLLLAIAVIAFFGQGLWILIAALVAQRRRADAHEMAALHLAGRAVRRAALRLRVGNEVPGPGVVRAVRQGQHARTVHTRGAPTVGTPAVDSVCATPTRALR